MRRMVVGMSTSNFDTAPAEITIVGDYERALAGDLGTCFSGRGGTSISGDNGHSVAGDDGYAITGAGGCASAGIGGIAVAGVGGSVKAGTRGVLVLHGRDGEREFSVTARVDGENGPLPGVYYRLHGHTLVPLAAHEHVGEVSVS